MNGSRSWLLFLGTITLTIVLGVLTGCASVGLSCADDRTLVKRGGTYVCQGFGSGFNWSPSVMPIRSAWWAS